MSHRVRNDESGTALVTTTILTVILMGFGLTVMTAVGSANREQSSSRAQLQRLYIAESGIRAAMFDISTGGDGNLGAIGAPVAFGGGGFVVDTVDNGDGTYTITSRGSHGTGRRVMRALVQERGHVFHHAIFAGNSSGDLAYTLDLGGFGDEADEIEGSVYSGNDVAVWGDADIGGELRAKGSITGASGVEGVGQPGFDFSGMNYESVADVRVADEFSSHQYSSYDNAGGTAMQVPEQYDSHIFRKNPSDRVVHTAATVKDDYFLEDPWESVSSGQRSDGSDAYKISLASNPGDSQYRKILYIDGNLWVHNYSAFGMQIESVGAQGSQVTFVVKGNIYFSDNVYIDDKDKDGIAFIALKDEAVSDSGNIYFGDPNFGTLEAMQAFMYAENDFHDYQLDATGSSYVEVLGTMAAGNHVSINRTYRDHHSALKVTLDERLRNGTLQLPGIPQQSQSLTYEVVSWIEVNPDS